MIERSRKQGGRKGAVAVSFGPGVTVEMCLLKRLEWKGREEEEAGEVEHVNGNGNGHATGNGNGPVNGKTNGHVNGKPNGLNNGYSNGDRQEYAKANAINGHEKTRELANEAGIKV